MITIFCSITKTLKSSIMFSLILHFTFSVYVHCISNNDIIYYTSNETYDASEVLRPNETRIRIDRTNLLEIFFNETEHPYNFLTCPRLFGKTSIIAMIEDFAQMEINEDGIPIHYIYTYSHHFHKGCKIGSNDQVMSEHLARYQVILIDMFSDSYQAITTADLIQDLKRQLKLCFEKFKWLPEILPRGCSDKKITTFEMKFVERFVNGTIGDDEIPECILRLSMILYKFFNQTKVIILVNEYDNAMLTSLVTQRTDVAKFYELVNEMLHNAFRRGAKYIAYGFIAGTSSLAYYRTYPSMLENVIHRPFLDSHPFNTFCGLSDSEAEIELFEKYKITRRERSKIQRFYKGYQLNSKNVSLYNPHSVTNYFLQSSDFQRTAGVFWNGGFSFEILVRFLANEYFLKMVFRSTERTMKLPFDLSHQYESTALCILMRLRKEEYDGFNAEDIRQRIMFTFAMEQGYILRGIEPNLFAPPNLEIRQGIQIAVMEHYQRKRVPHMNITKNMLSILKSDDI
ncbi:uncharacterized protein LOC135834437 isoform X1 [Planococcus citri]|uniref:uncharacterized protein LOC135834437 isoform X1 n=1 Tax=Planococcus citri TaxID=170843 RepID=UPI0031F8A4AE